MLCCPWARFALTILVCALLAGTFATVAAVRADDSKSGQAACFARLKKLTGDWVQKDPQGKEHLMLRYRVTAGGSALEEVIMPGMPDEMTSLYHMDGGSLVMTHYCSLGNQPHLKATSSSTPTSIVFECSGSGGNMKSEKEMHIHHVEFILPADDHFTAIWSGAANGKMQSPGEKFEVHRKTKS